MAKNDMKIELAKSKDGRETILRIVDPGSFPSKPKIHIGWIGQSKSLGPKGWENAPRPITSNSVRIGEDLLISLDASITNHIQAGTGVDISIPELGLSEQMVWPNPLPGTDRWDSVVDIASSGEWVDRVDRSVFEQAQGETVKAREKLGECEGELGVVREQLAAALKKLEEDGKKQAPGGPPSSTPGVDWRRVVAVLFVGIALGISGRFAYDWFATNRTNVGDAPSITELQRDLTRLRMEAFAPLANDLIQVANLSPKGQAPDQVAGRGLPPDKIDVVHDRARTFLNYGLEMASGRDAPEAVYWYRQSLRLCAADAMLYLGDAYFNGDGVPQDLRTGYQLMRISSSFGSRRASDLIKQILQSQRVPLAPPTFSDLYQRQR
jgi:hypothetical protein